MLKYEKGFHKLETFREVLLSNVWEIRELLCDLSLLPTEHLFSEAAGYCNDATGQISRIPIKITRTKDILRIPKAYVSTVLGVNCYLSHSCHWRISGHLNTFHIDFHRIKYPCYNWNPTTQTDKPSFLTLLKTTKQKKSG